MQRKLKAAVAILAAWNLVLTYAVYAVTRESQRMLCHATWPEKSVLECRSYFTGSTVTDLIVLGVGSALAIIGLGATLLALLAVPADEPPGEAG